MGNDSRDECFLALREYNGTGFRVPGGPEQTGPAFIEVYALVDKYERNGHILFATLLNKLSGCAQTRLMTVNQNIFEIAQSGLIQRIQTGA